MRKYAESSVWVRFEGSKCGNTPSLQHSKKQQQKLQMHQSDFLSSNTHGSCRLVWDPNWISRPASFSLPYSLARSLYSSLNDIDSLGLTFIISLLTALTVIIEETTGPTLLQSLVVKGHASERETHLLRVGVDEPVPRTRGRAHRHHNEDHYRNRKGE